MDVEFLRHQFEDGYDGVVVKNKFKLGVRHLQLVYMMTCAASLGALRGSAPVAVLALTDYTRGNDTYIQIYNWDRRVQGAIMSSFLFGYALMLIPAEILLRKIGGKYALTCALVVSGALSIAMPTIVSKGGWIAVSNAFLWFGVAQACLAPANQVLLCKFLPPNEKGYFGIVVHSCTFIGISIGMPMSGMLSEARLGWQLIFYAQAMLILSIACMWGLLTASTPDQHEAMGDTEKEFISTSLNSYKKKDLHVPWRSILQTRQFWAAAVAHTASNSVYTFFLCHGPAYLQTFGVSLRTSAWQSVLPLAALWLFRVTSSPTVDWLCRALHLGFRFNLSHLRKLINVIGASGVVFGLTMLSNLTPNWHGTAIVMSICTLGALGFQLSGFMDNLKDLSENFQGSMMIISRAVASAVGALIPIIVSSILDDDLDLAKRWRVVFLSLAIFYVICNVLYTVIGGSQRQPWDDDGSRTKFGYHNTLIDTNHVELEELNQTKLRQRNDDSNANITAHLI